MNTKKCPKCKKVLDVSFFYKHKNRPSGLHSRCKDCEKPYIQEYNLRPEIKIRHKKYADMNYRQNKKDIIKAVNLWHKTRDGGLFKKYLNAVSRCKYPSHSGYSYYGGRGISILWETYDEFKHDMEKEYLKHMKKFGHKNTTLERIDVNGNYCKENCKWATILEQSRNKRNTVDKKIAHK
jgi:hypothetical protein